jgi:hypothetical protein
MREREWELARVDFVDAFKAYEEAGHGGKTITVLKYLLLASMLSESRFNPFDDQSTKAYEKDPQVAAMTRLTDAYLANDIATFETVLRAHHAELTADEFLMSYIGDLLTSIRTQVALQLTAPYTRMSIPRLAADLGVRPEEAEALRDRELEARQRLREELAASGPVSKLGNSVSAEERAAVEVELCPRDLRESRYASARAEMSPATKQQLQQMWLLQARSNLAHRLAAAEMLKVQ